MSTRVKITKAGQVSVPAPVRKRWGASFLTAEDRGDHIVLRPAPDDPVDAAYGAFADEAKERGGLAEIRAEEREAEAAAEDGKGPSR